MNKVILLGNGFDLAHGLKTRYSDFIITYIKKCLNAAIESTAIENELISVKYHRANYSPPATTVIESLTSINSLKNNQDFRIDFDNTLLSVPHPIFSITCKSEFVKAILGHPDPTWVDIEAEYFSELNSIMSKPGPKQRGFVVQLNQQLKALGESLKIYLKREVEEFNINDVHESSPDFVETIVFLLFSKILLSTGTTPLRDRYGALIVNYNYTDTVNYYLDKNPHNYGVEVINLHGSLDQEPFIFGFGHVENASYNTIKESGIKEAFDGLKMYNYIKSRQYSKLLKYIDSDEFEVIIAGHSCGKSDGTTLRMIFEHENCKRILVTHIGEREFLDKIKDIMIHCRTDDPFKKIVPFDGSFKFPDRYSPSK